jgi:hypothetical protein
MSSNDGFFNRFVSFGARSHAGTTAVITTSAATTAPETPS